MLDRLIRRQRSARRGFAVAVICAFGLFAAVATLTFGWFGVIRVMGFFPFAQLLVQAALQSRWGRGANSKKSPLRQAECYGEPGAVLAAIDAEVVAGRDV